MNFFLVNLNQIKKVDVEDLLGRDPVEPKLNLLQKNIKDKNILVTGAIMLVLKSFRAEEGEEDESSTSSASSPGTG